jgi:PilZ domain
MSTAVEKPNAQPSRYARAYSEKRRGVRMNSRVPVAVEWEDSQGQRIRSKANTCVVSSYGCLVVLPDSLALDHQVVVVNLVTEQTIPGTVVWRGSLRDGGWELGIELSQPPADFWGLEL